jgi:hypothetical protein
MTLFQKVALAMGPERCRKALKAFDTPIVSWETCPLGRAYGRRIHSPTLPDTWGYEAQRAAALLDVTPQEVHTIFSTYDDVADDAALYDMSADEVMEVHLRFVELLDALSAVAELQ